MNDYGTDKDVQFILNELLKPYNRDLLIAVRDLGDKDRHQSFMSGFSIAYVAEMDFDEFVKCQNWLDSEMPALFNQLGEITVPDFRPMQVRYDEYLQSLKDRQMLSPINRSQAERWEAITNAAPGARGWSGAQYGWICRKVQSLLQPTLN